MKALWEKIGFYAVAGLCVVLLTATAIWRYMPQAAPETTATPPPDRAVDLPGADIETLPPVTGTPGPKPSPTPEPKLVLHWPVQGEILRGFGLAEQSVTRDWRMHEGLDIAAARGVWVSAALAGTVSYVTYDAFMGQTIILAHEGDYETQYSGLTEEVFVRVGDAIAAEQSIGLLGQVPLEQDDAPHLHFVLLHEGKAVNPAPLLAQ